MLDKESLENLSKRIELLEKELQSVKAELGKVSSTEKKNQTSTEILKPKIVAPSIPNPQTEKSARSFDWEILLGGNILGKLGLFAILLAFVWFLKFAFDNHWINESGRIFIGLFIGFTSITTGLFLAKRKMKIVPESIIGSGVSILYLSIYSAYYYYDLLGVKESFAAFALLSVGTSLLAGRTNLQVLYIFSLIGSILAPILLSSGENSYRFLFTYLTIINLIFYYISRMNTWRVSPFILFLANYIIFSAWADEKLTTSSPIPPLLYLTALYFIFGMREIYLMPRLRKSVDPLSLILLILMVISYTTFGFWVVSTFYPSLTSHFLLANAFFLVAFLKIHEVYSLPLLSGTSTNKAALSGILFLSWVTILFSAISNFSSERWIVFSWILFAGGLSVIGSYFRNKIYLIISVVPWLLALLRLYFVESLYNPKTYFLLNTRFGLFLLAVVFLVFTYQIQKKNPIHELLVGFIFTALFTLILGTLIEVRYFIVNPYFRNLGYSYVIAFYMIALLIPGFMLSYRSFRLTGIILGVLLILKFYFYDIWMMSVIVRIIAGFSLGIGLVILSIIYQKYKDKINVNQILKLTVFPLLLFCFLHSPNLIAEPFKNSGYKYQAEIKGLTKELVEDESIVYGKIRLTEDISRFRGSTDLRLVYGTELVPFFLRKVTNSAGKTGKTIPTVIYSNVSTNGRIYVLKLEEPPAKTEYTELEIAGTEKFEAGVYISLGEEPNDWQESTSASIYNYYDEQIGKTNRIKFRSGKYRYARLEFDSKIPFEFTGALYSPTKEKAEYRLDLKLEDLSKSIDPDRKATVYYYENPLHKAISRIVLNFEDSKYQRTLEVYQRDLSTKEYSLITDTTIYKKPDAKGEHNIEIPQFQGGNLKLLLVDNDDKPLVLKSIDAYSEMDEIVFEIPKVNDVDNSKKLILYYGNEFVRLPEFDIRTTYDEKLKHTNFKAGEHSVNSEFAYSLVEPPLSSWIIRGVFVFGLLGMAYPAFAILRRYKTELNLESENKEV